MQTGTITKFSVTFAKKFCKKNKNSCFSNLNTKKITDNRTFCKTVVTLFTNKLSKSENIIINECDKTISDEKKIVKYFTHFFLMLCPIQIYLILQIILRKRNFSPFRLLYNILKNTQVSLISRIRISILFFFQKKPPLKKQ